jgi:uncharacterized membrane protein YkvA (DUF1232 family)
MGAAQIARLVPDCAVLFARLARDPRVARRHKLVLLGAGAYLALPFDLIPDFIPVAGQADDAVVITLALRAVLRGAGPEIAREHWPGTAQGLEMVERLAHGGRWIADPLRVAGSAGTSTETRRRIPPPAGTAGRAVRSARPP